MSSEISKGNLATVKSLFAHCAIDPNEDRSSQRRGTKGQPLKVSWITVVLQARIAEPVQETILDLFLKAGADINQPLGESAQVYQYPIDLAVMTQSGDAFAKLLSFLLKNGANPNLGSKAWPPIVVVLTNSPQPGRIDYVISLYKKVVEAGGDPNPKWGAESAFRYLAQKALISAFLGPVADNEPTFDAQMELLETMIKMIPREALVRDINAVDECGDSLSGHLFTVLDTDNHGQLFCSQGSTQNMVLSMQLEGRLKRVLIGAGMEHSLPKGPCGMCKFVFSNVSVH